MSIPLHSVEAEPLLFPVLPDMVLRLLSTSTAHSWELINQCSLHLHITPNDGN
jgi:hypothetical protein